MSQGQVALLLPPPRLAVGLPLCAPLKLHALAGTAPQSAKELPGSAGGIVRRAEAVRGQEPTKPHDVC